MAKLRKYFTYRNIAILICTITVITILPLLYCSFFDYATGDDLYEGAAAHQAIIQNLGFSGFCDAIRKQFISDYYGWEGNWSSIILWCLEPSIWGEKWYCITPWIGLGALCGGTGYFLRHITKKYFSMPRSCFWCIYPLIVLFSVQFMPYPRGGLFWYTGMINYTFPYGLVLASLVWLDKYLESGKARYIIGPSLVMAYLGGSGYLPIVLAFECMFLLLVYCLLFQKKTIYSKRALYVLIPVVLLVTGFIISAISPGNAARGGDDYGFSVSRAIMTILRSLWLGLKQIPINFLQIRSLFMLPLITVIAAWRLIDLSESKLKFNHPVIVTVFLYLITASMYAPQVYANDEVSGGVPDMILFVFILCMELSVIYITGAVKSAYINKNKIKLLDETYTVSHIRIPVIVFCILFCMLLGKHLIGNSVAYTCYVYISSGQLADYNNQMKETLTILQSDDMDVVLPMINPDQGPLMHMPVTEDPDAYTNIAVEKFYGKNSVRQETN